MFIVTSILSCTSINDKKSTQDLTAAFEARDYDKALRLAMPLAEKGNAEAQALLGFLYIEGKGGLRSNNCEKGVAWIKKSVSQNNTNGIALLALLQMQGVCVEKNEVESEELLEKPGVKEAARNLFMQM